MNHKFDIKLILQKEVDANFKNSYIERPLVERISDEIKSQPLLSLNVNNHIFKELIHGDIFYNIKRNSIFLFLMLEEYYGYIEKPCFYEFNQSNINHFLEVVDRQPSKIRENEYFKTFSQKNVFKKNINEIDENELYFLTNFLYEGDLEKFILNFDGQLNNKELIGEFLLRINTFFEHSNNFKIVCKTKGNKVFNSYVHLIKMEILNKTITGFQPFIIIPLNIKNETKNNLCIMNSIYTTIDKENYSIQMNDDFQFIVLNEKRKDITNNSFKYRLNDLNNVERFDCFNESFEDEEKYINKYLYFL